MREEISVCSSGCWRCGLILVALKDPDKRPGVREELMRVVRNGRMLIETF
jgi:hypothetical protein